MLKIGVCDDHPLYIDQLSKIIKKISSNNNIDIDITSFESGESLVDFCSKHTNHFDILFLDILMNGINGITTAERIREIYPDIYIIFITSSRDYALDSYGVNAYGYILKPFDLDLIKTKFFELYEKIEFNKKNVIYVKNNQDIYTIYLDDVIYFESNLRKITAHIKNGDKISFYNKMSNLEDELNSTLFLRCHKSFLVNLIYVKSIVANDLITTTNKYLPISKKHLNSTRETFTEYIKLKLST